MHLMHAVLALLFVIIVVDCAFINQVKRENITKEETGRGLIGTGKIPNLVLLIFSCRSPEKTRK